MVKRLLIAASLAGAFAAGAAAEQASSGVSMRGKVMDANTIPETIEYWEVRSTTGESIVIMGRSDLPIVRALRQFKNRSVVVNIEPTGSLSTRMDDDNVFQAADRRQRQRGDENGR